MPEPSLQHEPDVTSVFPLWVGMLGTLGAVLLSSLGVWLTLEYYKEPLPPPRFHDEVKQPVGPRLQQNPRGDLVEFNRVMSERLNSTGWVNREEGLVHMPVERAMTLLAERGLPEEAQ